MKEFNAEQVRIAGASALETIQQAGSEKRYAAYVGLDVHKPLRWPGPGEMNPSTGEKSNTRARQWKS